MDGDPTTKAAVRKAAVAARRAVPQTQRDAEAEALRAHLLGLANSGTTVCAYVPVGTEPGSVAMLDALVAAGARVLLPVARAAGGVAQPLHWGEYQAGALVAAPFGLREPAPPWLPP